MNQNNDPISPGADILSEDAINKVEPKKQQMNKTHQGVTMGPPQSVGEHLSRSQKQYAEGLRGTFKFGNVT